MTEPTPDWHEGHDDSDTWTAQDAADMLSLLAVVEAYVRGDSDAAHDLIDGVLSDAHAHCVIRSLASVYAGQLLHPDPGPHGLGDLDRDGALQCIAQQRDMWTERLT